MKIPNPYTQQKLAEARTLPPHDGLLASINAGFHATYTRVVEQVLAQLGDSVAVIILIGDDATLLFNSRERREQFIPPRYHALKAVAHLAFSIQLTLMANGSGRLTELTVSELHEKRRQIRDAQAVSNTLSTDASSISITKAPAELLCRARELVDRVLSEGAVEFDRIEEHLGALASSALETVRVAVCIELEQLDALVRRWRNEVGEPRWAGLYVVICGAHQPRYREATCQYFGKLLHQSEGAGAEREDRLVYAEGMCDLKSALDLLARHIVDQRASALLFGDRRRLQQDLLADAASEEVRKLFPKTRCRQSGAPQRRR
jgi:hypothetical protein